MPADVLDAKGVQALEPDLAFDVRGGVLYPLDAHLVPQRLVAAMTSLVEERGGRILWSAEVKDWKTAASRVSAAVTSAGEIGGEDFVLTAGSWTPIVARGLGLRLPMQPGKNATVFAACGLASAGTLSGKHLAQTDPFEGSICSILRS